MSDIEFRFEVVRARWDQDGIRVIEEMRLIGTSIRHHVWGNSGADPCRDLSAVVGIEDPRHTS